MPTLTKSQINTDILMRWAQRKLGPSKCERILIVDRKSLLHGWYDWDGSIYINIRHIGSMVSIYRILAHEWTHAQQKGFMYARLYKRHGYRNHPYEIAARRRERSCFSELFVTFEK